MADFGFVGDAYTTRSIYQDAQECINFYLEIDPNKMGSQAQPAGRGVIALYPTPGYGDAKVQLTAGEVRGMHVMSGGNLLFAVSGNAVYSIDSTFTATSIGTLNTSSGSVSLTDNGLALYIVDGNDRYSYIVASSTFGVISGTDGAFTGGDVVDVVDNYFIYNRPGTQQWAASTALSTVTPGLSFSSKDGAPDNLVTLIAVGRNVFLIGEVTSEVWINVGSFPFPFQRIPGTSTQHGCAAKRSIARIGETFGMVSKDIRGQGIVVHAEGYGFKRMSTHAVETSLIGQVISDAIGWSYQIEGHEFYVVNFPTADLTWVYDLATDKWHKWLSVDSLNIFHRQRGNCFASFQGYNLIGDYQNGAIYSLSYSTYTENGNTIRRVRRCPHLVSDFKRQFFDSLQIQFQPGVGLSTGQGQDPQAMLRWSNDGGSTWSNEHWKSIGLIGKYKNRAIWRRLGQARDRIFEVVITDPINAVIISAELEETQAEN